MLRMDNFRFSGSGQNVKIHSKATIGEEGFGFEREESEFGYKIPMIRRSHDYSVVIGDNVEIASLVSIDRGRHRDTIIGEGTKIDHHVHIGHNAIIGKNCLLCSHANIGGSCEIGDRVKVWMSAVIIDHIKIGEGSVIGAGALIVHDVPPNTTIKGIASH